MVLTIKKDQLGGCWLAHYIEEDITFDVTYYEDSWEGFVMAAIVLNELTI